MARKFAFTRTVKAQKVSALCYNAETSELENHVTTISPPVTDEKIRKAVEKALNSDTLTVVEVADVETVNTLYGMTLDDFIKYATPVHSASAE